MLDKGRKLVVEGNDFHFITGIGRTVARDDCSAGIVIKGGTCNSYWILYAI